MGFGTKAGIGAGLKSMGDKGWQLSLFLLQEDIKKADRARRIKLAQDFNDALAETGDPLQADAKTREKNGLKASTELADTLKTIKTAPETETPAAAGGVPSAPATPTPAADPVGATGKPIQPVKEPVGAGVAVGEQPTPGAEPAAALTPPAPATAQPVVAPAPAQPEPAPAPAAGRPQAQAEPVPAGRKIRGTSAFEMEDRKSVV